MNRRNLLAALAWLAPALATGCGGDEMAPVEIAPLRYDYLTPIRLNVGSIEIEQRWVSQAGTDDVAALSPVQPVEALRQMAADRLVAVGSAGRAVFVIEEASILQAGDQYVGHLKVRLDIYADAPSPIAFAEARASRTKNGSSDGDGQRQALYQLTRQLMDDINVEFEYQVKRALHDQLQAPTAPAPAPIEEQNLSPPPRS